MAAIASAYFLEYTTRKTQPDWLDNLEQVFGTENIKGARSHVNHDIKDGHNDFVWKVLMEIVHDQEDVERLKKHIENIYGLFAAYFLDVYQETLNKEQKTASHNVPSFAVNFSKITSNNQAS